LEYDNKNGGREVKLMKVNNKNPTQDWYIDEETNFIINRVNFLALTVDNQENVFLASRIDSEDKNTQTWNLNKIQNRRNSDL
jgi:hypothetical protein